MSRKNRDRGLEIHDYLDRYVNNESRQEIEFYSLKEIKK